MATNRTAVGLCLAALALAGIQGCNDAKVTGEPSTEVKSTYGNITDHDPNAWPQPRPEAKMNPPASDPMAKWPDEKPAPAPRPQPQGDIMYIPTGDRATSVISITCRMPSQVVAGQNFTYEADVCNLTNLTLGEVIFTHDLVGAQIVSSDPPMANGIRIGEMAPRACRTIKVTAKPTGVGMVRGCSGATWVHAMCCGTNVVQPALKIVKTVTPAEVSVCDSVTYTITVTNTGTGDATNVKVRDQLPTGVAAADGRNTIEQPLGTLGAGQSRTVTFAAKASKSGNYENDASAMADLGLSATSNKVSFAARQPMLQVTSTCDKQRLIGQPATYKFKVTNTGNGPAQNLVLEASIPQGATYSASTDGGATQAGNVRWSLGTLAPNASREVGATFIVMNAGSFTSTARATAACADSSNANCTITYEGLPDIGTLVTDANGVIAVGADHEVTCEVKNQGQVVLTNAKMVLTLPDGMQFVRTSVNPSNYKVEGQKITFFAARLEPAQIARFTVIVKATKPGEMLMIGETSCDQLDKSVRDDELTNFYMP